MKRLFIITIVALIFSGAKSFSQTISLPADSISTLLCKKWEVDYAMMGGMKIGKLPGAPEMNYEFSKDKTFMMTSNDPKDKKKGTWFYDSKKKLIKLTVDGKVTTTIISLKDEELIMLVDTKEVTPDDPSAIQLVYKVTKK